jgi:hypothetical protein
MIVVEVRDQHGIDSVDHTRYIPHRLAMHERREAAAQDGIGKEPGVVNIDAHRGMTEERYAHRFTVNVTSRARVMQRRVDRHTRVRTLPNGGLRGRQAVPTVSLGFMSRVLPRAQRVAFIGK